MTVITFSRSTAPTPAQEEARALLYFLELGGWIGALTLTCGLALAANAAEPAPLQTVKEFKEAVSQKLIARGDKMGYGLQKCPLVPSFSEGGATYLGRAFSGSTDTILVLVAAKDGQVVRWEEFDLPGFNGWFTHYTASCSDSVLTLKSGGVSEQFRWDGRRFSPVTTRKRSQVGRRDCG